MTIFPSAYVPRPAALGVKRSCVGCAARFYDLRRSPPTCPKCQAVQPPDRPRATRIVAPHRPTPVRAGPARVQEAAEAEALEPDADTAVDDADPDEDADTDTDDDDDDVPSVPSLE